jgi:DNA-binding IclR family transcriptional regulator
MAKLFAGEKDDNSRRVLQLLRKCFNGLREIEIAQELGWDRRTANNYLRELKKQGRVHKEGRDWHLGD